jgi:hypothetical protein
VRASNGRTDMPMRLRLSTITEIKRKEESHAET